MFETILKNEHVFINLYWVSTVLTIQIVMFASVFFLLHDVILYETLANFYWVYVCSQVLILHEILDKLLIEQVAAYKGFQFSDITKEDLREFIKGRSTATLGIMWIIWESLSTEWYLPYFRFFLNKVWLLHIICYSSFHIEYLQYFLIRWIESFWSENNCEGYLRVAGGTCHSCSWLNQGIQCTCHLDFRSWEWN